MQIALVSDIHANIQAWKAVLLDFRSLGIDTAFCLGDIVGYGPNPAETLSSVNANCQHMVLGNHDAVVCGKLKPDLFNEKAADLIRWSMTRLNDKAFKMLSALPLSINCPDFRCAHGDLGDPSAFNYVSGPDEAAPSWNHAEGNLFFIGHTHEPAIFILGDSGIPRSVEPQDFIVEEDRRYVVNTGSVGQPRDGLALASYCILETSTRSVFWRRVPFDIDEYRKAVLAAGLDVSVNGFLNFDPRGTIAPAREYTDFSPPVSISDKANGAVQIRELNLMASKARRWKASFAVTLITLILGLGTAGTAGYRHYTKKLIIEAGQHPSGSGTQLAGLDLERGTCLPLKDFSILLGNRRKQSACVKRSTETSCLQIASGSYDVILIQTPAINARGGQKLALEALIRKSPDFRGNATAFIAVTKKVNGRTQHSQRYLVKEPNLPRKNDFLLARHTFELPANTTHVALGLAARFSGSIEVARLELTEKSF